MLLWVEEFGRCPFKHADIQDLAEDFELDAEDSIACKHVLYTMLVSFTAGRVRGSIRRAKATGILESYRKLHFKSLRLTPKYAFFERADLWKVEEVTVEHLEDAIEKWEEKLEYVVEQQDYHMSNIDKVQALLQMCPSSLRLKLLEEQNRGEFLEYDDLRDEIMFRIVDLVDNGGKKVNAVHGEG